MKMKSTFAVALISAAVAVTVFAQQPAAPAGAKAAAPAAAAGATGGVAVASEPGKAAVVRAVEISAQVVGLDKATRTLTLKGPKGNVMDIVAGDEVKNFDQIKLGDAVVARYAQALVFELKKTRVAAGDVAVKELAAKAKPGERPAVAGARQVTVLADVVAVDPKAGTITLKGPKGNEVVLPVENPDQFKVVKKGDQVEATYTEAVALSVEAAPKAPAAKK
jgi:hypothetical protein